MSGERQTGDVRIYLPATLDDLNPSVTGPDGTAGFVGTGPWRVHAVTDALRTELPEEDEEGLEFAAQLAAADDSLLRLAGRPTAPHLRLVLAVDVPAGAVGAVDDDDAPPSAVTYTGPVTTDDVVSAHVDEVDARADVERAMTGDEHAVERLAQRHLLWYDASELVAIPR